MSTYSQKPNIDKFNYVARMTFLVRNLPGGNVPKLLQPLVSVVFHDRPKAYFVIKSNLAFAESAKGICVCDSHKRHAVNGIPVAYRTTVYLFQPDEDELFVQDYTYIRIAKKLSQHKLHLLKAKKKRASNG